MKVPDGLLIYEYVLLLLGVVLFFTLLIILIIYVARKEAIKGLLIFFALPVLMIGYPSIQKISFNQDGLELEKLMANVESNPGSESARAELAEGLENVDVRRVNTNESKLEMARGNALLDNSETVNKYLRSVKIKNPEEERKVQDIRSIMGRRSDLR